MLNPDRLLIIKLKISETRMQADPKKKIALTFLSKSFR